MPQDMAQRYRDVCCAHAIAVLPFTTTSSTMAMLTLRSETLLPAQKNEHLIDHVRA